jgi:hypothetical protein
MKLFRIIIITINIDIPRVAPMKFKKYFIFIKFINGIRNPEIPGGYEISVNEE